MDTKSQSTDNVCEPSGDLDSWDEAFILDAEALTAVTGGEIIVEGTGGSGGNP
jgi:hypothetical protein